MAASCTPGAVMEKLVAPTRNHWSAARRDTCWPAAMDTGTRPGSRQVPLYMSFATPSVLFSPRDPQQFSLWSTTYSTPSGPCTVSEELRRLGCPLVLAMVNTEVAAPGVVPVVVSILMACQVVVPDWVELMITLSRCGGSLSGLLMRPS